MTNSGAPTSATRTSKNKNYRLSRKKNKKSKLHKRESQTVWTRNKSTQAPSVQCLPEAITGRQVVCNSTTETNTNGISLKTDSQSPSKSSQHSTHGRHLSTNGGLPWTMTVRHRLNSTSSWKAICLSLVQNRGRSRCSKSWPWRLNNLRPNKVRKRCGKPWRTCLSNLRTNFLAKSRSKKSSPSREPASLRNCRRPSRNSSAKIWENPHPQLSINSTLSNLL